MTRKRKSEGKALESRKKSASVSGFMADQVDDESAEEGDVWVVPMKSIVQARHERHLVEILLRRIRARESGDYMSSLDELTLGSVFPGHFYKQSKVCKNCYKIYTLVDEHRSRAVAKLQSCTGAERGIFGAEGAPFDSEVYDLQRPHTIETLSPIKRSQKLFDAITEKDGFGNADSDAAVSVDDGSVAASRSMENFETEEVRGMRRAYEAIADLEKTDVAELRR